MRRGEGKHEKFFRCQKRRLRVRAARFQPDQASRNDVDDASIAQRVMQRSACGAGTSFHIDKCLRRFPSHYLHRLLDALSRCLRARVARLLIGSSTLP
jgi:hypothetical protein